MGESLACGVRNHTSTLAAKPAGIDAKPGRGAMDSAWIRSTFSRGIVGLAVAAFVALSPGSFLDAAQNRDGSAEADGLSSEMIDLVAAHNRERAAQKLEPLTANAKLTAA